jgi:aromatic-L-amino-acid decarboxylase
MNEITSSQRSLGDMDVHEFRKAAHRVADLVADYLERLREYRVYPNIEPGWVAARLASEPPGSPESLDTILDDYLRLIEPNITHWQHPHFLGYFPSTASGPGILGEWLAAGLNSNVMFWRNAPASTELEGRVVEWLRDLLGLPERFEGMFTDTASVSSLLALVAARHAVPGLDAREEGLAGREGVGRLRLYLSEEAHMSIEKGAIVAGIGRRGVCRIPVDDSYRMDVSALREAVRRDRGQGWIPFCVVGTLGTTSSTSVDPANDLARVCEDESLWLHLDAAYGGAMALVPEFRALLEGWDRAHSIVVNPHKWMFTPFDASLLFFRDAEGFRDAFSVVPEYLKTPDVEGVKNYNEYGIQLGRRFRALKLWILIRWFGGDGLAARVREHVRMAHEFAQWIEDEPEWELLAPVPMATVCFRFRPESLSGRESEPEVRAALDGMNETILRRINQRGEFYLSHTRLRDRYALRVAIGNPRIVPEDLARCREVLRESAREVIRQP